jgi:hypothetical protein
MRCWSEPAYLRDQFRRFGERDAGEGGAMVGVRAIYVDMPASLNLTGIRCWHQPFLFGM